MAIWPQFTLSLEPITVLVVGLLLCYKIYVTIGFKGFWLKHKAQLILLVIYFSVCFISLYLNRGRYQNSAEFIRFGVTFVVITGVFPALLLLFSLPQNTKGLSLTRFKSASWLPLGYFALLALMVIWQYLDYQGANSIGQFFVSSELWPNVNINGFFRVSTDIAPVLALLVFFTVTAMLNAWSIGRPGLLLSFIMAMLVVLFIVAGGLTGSRVFLLMFLVAPIVLLFNSRLTLTQNILSLLFVFFAGHVFIVLSNPIFMGKLTLFFPYLKVLYYGVPFNLSDFDLNLSIHSTARNDIWSTALEHVKQNPFFGVTSGLVRLNGPSLQNTHNFIIQLLVNSGVIGFVIVCMLATTIRKQLSHSLVIILAISLLVDYPLEHSLPWSITVCYILTNSLNQIIQSKGVGWCNHPLLARWVVIVALLTCIVILVTIFKSRQHELLIQSQNIRLGTQISSRLDYGLPILLDSESLSYKDFKTVADFPWYRINKLGPQQDLCHYDYLPNRYSYLADSPLWLNYVEKNDCSDTDVIMPELVSSADWITNMVHWNHDKNWNFSGHMGIWSPLVKLESELNLEFQAKGQYGLGSWPTAQVTLFNSNRQVVVQKKLSIDSTQFSAYSVTFPIKHRGHYFLSIHFINDAYDRISKQDRNIWINKESIILLDNKLADI